MYSEQKDEVKEKKRESERMNEPNERASEWVSEISTALPGTRDDPKLPGHSCVISREPFGRRSSQR